MRNKKNNKTITISGVDLLNAMENAKTPLNPFLKKKKDNSKNGDIFLYCRSCKQIITNDYRSRSDTRYCADCL